MIIVSIDPGVTTGVAIYDVLRKETFVCSYHTDNLEGILPILWLSHTILIETTPGAGILPIASSAYPHVLTLLQIRNCVHISPGHWKPVAKTLEWKVDSARDQHQKDAYNMLSYWMRSTTDKDIGNG